MDSRGQGWFSRGARSSLKLVSGAVAFGGLLLASAAWSAEPDAGSVSSVSGTGGVSGGAADAPVSTSAATAASSASASEPYPLSADGKYYVVNLLRRNYFPPTALSRREAPPSFFA